MSQPRDASIAFDVRRYGSVTSTMDLATEAVEQGAAEGLVIVADEQTSGRGRRGRHWTSPAGAGLYVSIVLRPSLQLPAEYRVFGLITLTAGVAVHDAIAGACALAPELKWPNDVVLGRRKLAGVLAEATDVGASTQAIVLGVGINVRSAAYPPDIADRATSLEQELGRAVDRDLLCDRLLAAIDERYRQLGRGGADDILRSWREASPSAQGARVEWDAAHQRRQGVTAGIDATGALLVKTGTGIERMVAGELTWLR